LMKSTSEGIACKERVRQGGIISTQKVNDNATLVQLSCSPLLQGIHKNMATDSNRSWVGSWV
jgi:hypothetical protein